jgi:hypothetical protein
VRLAECRVSRFELALACELSRVKACLLLWLFFLSSSHAIIDHPWNSALAVYDGFHIWTKFEQGIARFVKVIPFTQELLPGRRARDVNWPLQAAPLRPVRRQEEARNTLDNLDKGIPIPSLRHSRTGFAKSSSFLLVKHPGADQSLVEQ